MTLREEILDMWTVQLPGKGREIDSVKREGYPAAAMTLGDGDRCVCIPWNGEKEISEEFADVKLSSAPAVVGLYEQPVLMLESGPIASPAFAAFCAEFIAPGKDGANRKEILRDPTGWWETWKKLIGNRNVDPTVYDVLGELVALQWLAEQGLAPIWIGPAKGPCDIDCGDLLYEVKSTTVRNTRRFTAHGLFQLDPEGRERRLLFCQFQKASAGETINGMAKKLVSLGFDRVELESALSELGYGSGKSSRNEGYDLLAMTEYVVDEDFPHISKSSFKAGDLPSCVASISYDVVLDGVKGTSIFDLKSDAQEPK